MTKYTEATLVGVFGPNDITRLSQSLRGARWRHMTGHAEGFASDVLTYCAQNIDPQDVIDFVGNAIGDSNGVLIIDDDHEEAPRAIVFRFGNAQAETSAA